MKKSMKAAAALAGAAVVVVGGTAFTNSVASMDSTELHAYGETAVTGVTVSSTEYTYNSTDNQTLEKVKWHLSAPTSGLVNDDLVSVATYGAGLTKAGKCTYSDADDYIECTWLTSNVPANAIVGNASLITLEVDEDNTPE